MEKLNEKFQVLKVEKISLEEIYELNKTLKKKCGKPVHQAFVADSEAESEPVKIAYKIVIASDQDIYWSSTANEFSYYNNIVMKEDIDGFLGDDEVTNTVIDAHNYILIEQESKLDYQNFYFSVILFVNYKY
ncbi:unnamed protein product [Malus baccata var. baccata]